MGISVHNVVTGILGRHTQAQVHGQIHGQNRPLWTHPRSRLSHCTAEEFTSTGSSTPPAAARAWLRQCPTRLTAGRFPLAARGLTAVLARTARRAIMVMITPDLSVRPRRDHVQLGRCASRSRNTRGTGYLRSLFCRVSTPPRSPRQRRCAMACGHC
jgi:hypothetical protein